MPDLSFINFYFVLPLLEFFRHMFGNYGWAIILVTIALKLILLPLSIKQIANTKKAQDNMAKIKPELDKLKEKYEAKKKKHEGDNTKTLEIQQEFQKEMLSLYNKNGGINPMGGCLPLLLQLPILIALYWAFTGSPFQASINTLNLQAISKAPVFISEKNIHSSPSIYIGRDGEIMRYGLITNIPNDGKIEINKNYDIWLEQKSKKKYNINASGESYWRIRSSKEAKDNNSLHPNRKYLEENNINSPNTKQNKWYSNVLELKSIALSDKEKANNIYEHYQIKANKETDGNFTIDNVLINDRAKHSFLFLKDITTIGLYDNQTKQIHFDVVILMIFMIISFWLTTKSMNNNTSMPSLDPNQEKLQKQMQVFMPLFFTSFFIFMPLPSAVFLYFVISNIIQVLQSKYLK